MVTILLNTVTIALETTSLSTTHALLFTATDNIFLGIYLLEFALKVQSCSQSAPTSLVKSKVYD